MEALFRLESDKGPDWHHELLEVVSLEMVHGRSCGFELLPVAVLDQETPSLQGLNELPIVIGELDVGDSDPVDLLETLGEYLIREFFLNLLPQLLLETVANGLSWVLLRADVSDESLILGSSYLHVNGVVTCSRCGDVPLNLVQKGILPKVEQHR